MAYSIIDPQPDPRDAALAYDDAGPGLYPGELLVAIDDHFAAVSIETGWPDNNSGVTLTGCARWCDAMGQTVLIGTTHVEVGPSQTFSAYDAAHHSLADLTKEMVLLMLGEAPALMRDVPQEGGSTTQWPVLAISDEIRLNASIRQAIACVSAIQQTTDLSAALQA